MGSFNYILSYPRQSRRIEDCDFALIINKIGNVRYYSSLIAARNVTSLIKKSNFYYWRLASTEIVIAGTRGSVITMVGVESVIENKMIDE